VARKMEARIQGVRGAVHASAGAGQGRDLLFQVPPIPPPLPPLLSQEHEAVKQRQAERLADLEAASAEAAKHAALKSRVEAEVDGRVKQWSRGKSIRQMLVSLHVVLTTRTGVPDYSAAASSTNPDELKKAYFKAIRLVHPDKVAPTATLEAQIESQKVFAALSDAYKRYIDSEAAGGGSGGGGLSSFTSAAQQNRQRAGVDIPSFGGFAAGAGGVSGAAARARAAFNAMHSATRGAPPPMAAGVGGGAASAAAAGVRFAPFGASGPPGGYTGASTSWGAGGSFTSR
jgi:hypothetical protein